MSDIIGRLTARIRKCQWPLWPAAFFFASCAHTDVPIDSLHPAEKAVGSRDCLAALARCRNDPRGSQIPECNSKQALK